MKSLLFRIAHALIVGPKSWGNPNSHWEGREVTFTFQGIRQGKFVLSFGLIKNEFPREVYEFIDYRAQSYEEKAKSEKENTAKKPTTNFFE